MDSDTPADRRIELLTAPSRGGLDRRILELLKESIDPAGIPRFVYLSPTRRKNREMTEKLRIERPSWKPLFMVPATAAEQMVDCTKDPGLQWVTAELKELLVLRILELARDNGGMETLRFRDHPTPMGIARHVIAALDSLYRRGLTLLDKEAGLSDPVARDLEAVRIELEKTLHEHKLLDPSQVLGLAGALLRAETEDQGGLGLSRLMPGLPENLELLVLDGFAAPDRIEADFLVELVRRCTAARVVVTMPSQAVEEIRSEGWEGLSSEFRLYRHGRRFFEQLGVLRTERLGAATKKKSTTETRRHREEKIGRSQPQRHGDTGKRRSGEVNHRDTETMEPIVLCGEISEESSRLDKKLKDSSTEEPVPESPAQCAPPDRRPTLTIYPDRVSEVKGLARSIKRIFLERGGYGRLNPEDFHVIVPRIGPYYRLIIEIFPRYGIPFNITRGIPLSSIPVVGRIQALMDAAMARDHDSLFRFFASDLVSVPAPGSDEKYGEFLDTHADLLGSGFSGARPEEPTSPRTLDAALLDRVCRSAGIRGGPDFVEDWVAPFAHHYHRRIAAARDARELGRESRTAEEYRHVVEQLWLLNREFAQMDGLAASDTAQAVISRLQALLDRYRLYGNLVRSLVEVEAIVHVGRQIMFEKNIKGFTKAMEVLVQTGTDLDAAGAFGTGLDMIRRLFSERCRREMIQEAGELAGVSISQALEIRNLAGPVVFLAGMTAQDFPDTATRNFLLPSGPNTEAFVRAGDTSRFLLSHVLRECEEAHISCPEAEAGEPLGVSPLVEELGCLKPIHGEKNATTDNECTQEATAFVGTAQDTQFFSGHEILEAVGCAWREDELLPLNTIRELLSQYRLEPGMSVETFRSDVRRGLEAGLLRSRTDKPGPYDGIIRDPGVLQAINDMLDRPSYSYSVSMLHTYLRCPLAFFFQRVLGIEPVKEIPEELEAAEIGSVAHEILARFYAHRNEPVRRADRVDACCRMFETAMEVLDGHDFLSKDLLDAWAVRERITRGLYPSAALGDDLRARLDAGTDLPPGKRGILRVLLDHEAKLELGLRPWKVEFDFGFTEGSHLEIPGKDGRPIRVRGRIDRIDRASGTDSSELLWVYDYKTGRAPTPADVKTGKDLQLQLYLLAAKERLGKDSNDGSTEVGACFLTLKPGEKDLRKSMIVTAGVPKELRTGSSWELSEEDLEGVKEIVRRVDSSIRQGDFHRAADESACTFCDYRSACFRDEHRIRMLRQG